MTARHVCGRSAGNALDLPTCSETVSMLPGSLRHDFALEVGRNLTHASDSVENGANEAALWFKPEELVDWNREVDRWVFEK